MITFPNAKINIGLDILKKRPDGYHDISTVMMPVPWTDVLEIVPGNHESDTLTVTGRKVDCPPQKNLVMKAVKSLRGIADFPPVDMFLHKVIPDGAGLGGGSADAAFALTAVNNLFNLGLEKDELASVASAIGADCPFFIYNRPMACTGTGTRMHEFELSLPAGLTLVIVKPPVSVPTKDAYKAVSPAIPNENLEQLLSSLPVEKWQGCVKNDFEPSVFPSYPVIAEVKRRLLAEGAVYASMSGSGSSVYGFFAADIMTECVAAMFPCCDIMVQKL